MHAEEESPEHPDYWFRIIVELEKVISLRSIAQKVGTSSTALCRFKSGVCEPRYSVGNRLISLHRYRAILTRNCSANGTQASAQSV